MTDTRPFAPITRETVSAQVRAQLLQRITTGEMPPGSRIPSERELSDHFAVARTSVREALQGLMSLGVVERRGNRSYVAEYLPEVTVNPANDRKSFVAELFETRRVLEIPILKLATERADDEARKRVATVAAAFGSDLDIASFRRLDREFHTTIAACCGNPFLIELYGKVLDRLFRSEDFDTLLSAQKNRPSVKRIVAQSSKAHEAIARAFLAGSVDGVLAAAHEHLDAVEQSLVDELD